MRIVVAGAALAALSLSGVAQAQRVAWQSVVHGTILGEYEAGGVDRKVVVDAAGDLYFTGTGVDGDGVFDCRTLKLSGATGAIVWQDDFEDGDEYMTECAVALDSVGDVIFAGRGGREFRVRKLSGANGARLWESATSGTPASTWVFKGRLRGIALDAAGNVYVTGSRVDLEANASMRTAKFRGTDGALQWDAFDAAVHGVGVAVQADAAGAVVVAGFRGNPGDAGRTWEVVKYSPAGAVVWRRIDASASYAYDETFGLALDGAGNAYVSGAAKGAGGTDYRTIKLAAGDGALLWQAAHAGAANGDDVPRALALDPAGDVVVTGYSTTSAAYYGQDILTIKYAGATGAVRWQQAFDSPTHGSDYAQALAIDTDGTVIVGGELGMDGSYNSDFATIKYSSSGELLWQRSYAGASARADAVRALAVAAGGAVIAVGVEGRAGGQGSDLKAIKYSSSGTALWQTGPLLEPRLRRTRIHRLTIGPDGNPVGIGAFQGVVLSLREDDDLMTIKWDRATGNVLWRAPYVMADTREFPVQVAMGTNGDVWAVGEFVENQWDNRHGRVMKYQGSNGALVFDHSYPASNFNWGYALDAVADGSGNLYVGGHDMSAGFSRSNRLFKFSAGGSMLWERQPNDHSRVTHVAVDGAGNVLATSSGATSQDGRFDDAVVKYSGAGALLWNVSAPPGIRALSVDAAGNVIAMLPDFRMVKLAGSNGAVMWDAAPPAAGVGVSEARALTVDLAGNPIATGDGWRAIKLSGANGALVWERGPRPGANAPAGLGRAYDVRADAAGDVWIAGASGDAMRVSKFAGNDGRTLWELDQGSTGGFLDTVSLAIAGDSIYAAGSTREPNDIYAGRLVKIERTGPGGLAVALASSSNPAESLAPVTLTATMTSANAAPLAGTVSFRVASVAIPGCEAIVPSAARVATCTTTALPGGTQELTAQYSGDAMHPQAWSAVLLQVVNRLSTSVQLTSSANPQRTGFTATLIATVAAGPSAGGTVNFEANGQPVNGCTGAWVVEGRATCDYRLTAPGSVAMRAVYLGGATHAGAVSNTLLQEWNENFLPFEPPLLPGDFNGDGRSDLLWPHGGRTEGWLMSGTNRTAQTDLSLSMPTLLMARHAADFNGDGKDDILWQDTSGRVVLWLMDGLTRLAERELQPAYSTWMPDAVGDFNGDGKADIAWRHVLAPRAQVWLMNGLETLSSTTHEGNGFRALHAADFNGDGKDDIVWRHGDGRVVLWLMNGGTFIGSRTLQPVGSAFAPVHVGDLDGDGKVDIVWENPDGRTVLWLMDGTATKGSLTVQAVGSAWRATHLADLNGDGKKDILWRHATGGNAVAWLMNGVSYTASRTLRAAGSGWSIVRTGDFDGDNKADLLWQSQSGQWEIWLMAGLDSTSQATFTYTNPPLVPAPTTVTLSVAPTSITAGGQVELRATVSSTSGTPSGAVTFRRGSTSIPCHIPGSATCQTSAIPGGTHLVTAHYAGGPGFAASSSAPVSLTVNPAATTPVVSGPASMTFEGSPASFTVVVHSSYLFATGTVTFYADGAEIAGCVGLPPPSSAPYTCTTTTLATGLRAITASYSGDASTLPGSSASPFMHTVGSAPPRPATPNARLNMPSVDVNGDGNQDLVWEHQDGQTMLWFMNGPALLGITWLTSANAEWRLAHYAQLDGAGTDLVWGHRDGLRVEAWLSRSDGTFLMNPVHHHELGWTPRHAANLSGGATDDLVINNADGRTLLQRLWNGFPAASATVQPAGSSFGVSHVGDFNGDGRTDLLWRHPDGRVIVWLMNGLSWTQSRTLLAAGSGWTPVHARDFNGDGKSDILWEHSDGRTAVWLMDGTLVTATADLQAAGSAWRVTHTGDFDGDGRADIVWRNVTYGNVVIWLMNGTTYRQSRTMRAATTDWTLISTRDLTGDGRSDLLWQYRDGSVELWPMTGLEAGVLRAVAAPGGLGWRLVEPK